MTPYIPEKMPPKDLDWKSAIELQTEAVWALAQYSGKLEGIPNPDVLLSPLTSQEAVLSSKIEGTQATLGEVLEFEAGKKDVHPVKRDDIHEILNYRAAMRLAISSLNDKPITLNLIRDIHYRLLRGVRGHNKRRGEFRRDQTWIGPRGCKQEDATFVPPSPLILGEFLTNLENFINKPDPNFLIQLGLIHAQFELIHPFVDGNGRVGRILIPLFLYQTKRLPGPNFYLSKYLEKNRDQYYGSLQQISKDDNWNSWMNFFLTGVITQSKENIEKVQKILILHEDMKEVVSNITRSMYAIQTVDAIFESPFLSIPYFSKKSGVPKISAARIINRLVEQNILRLVIPGKGRRPGIYSFHSLIETVEN